LDRTHEALEPVLFRSCETWAAAAEGGWTRRDRGILAVGCAAGQRSFNQIIVTSSDLDPGALREAISWYEPNGGHFRLRLRGELNDAVRETVEAAGLERRGEIPTMTFTGVLPPGRETTLRIERVADERTLADHVLVVAESFDWPANDLGHVFTARLLGEPDFAAWVGYEGDVAVASSQLVVHGGVAGLYYVGTVQESRRKGNGEAIVRAAIAEGLARGCDLVCLQASPLGRPVYERLGFDVIGEYVTYYPAETADA
jgi:GNAT superfamily N-acetyltransferase